MEREQLTTGVISWELIGHQCTGESAKCLVLAAYQHKYVVYLVELPIHQQA